MSKMHADEFHIDQSLVQKLIRQQFPEWANFELAPVLSAGTDHALYRLGTMRKKQGIAAFQQRYRVNDSLSICLNLS